MASSTSTSTRTRASPANGSAFIYYPFLFQTGAMLAQVKEQSNWREMAAAEEGTATDETKDQFMNRIVDHH